MAKRPPERELPFTIAKACMEDAKATSAAVHQDERVVLSYLFAMAYVMLRNAGVTREAMLAAIDAADGDREPKDITPPPGSMLN